MTGRERGTLLEPTKTHSIVSINKYYIYYINCKDRPFTKYEVYVCELLSMLLNNISFIRMF